MRSFCLLVFAVTLLVTAIGCGDPAPPPPLTDEMKKAIQEEDKRVAEEEGGKPQPKKGKSGKH